ncbi:hypothetical protein CR513_02036, partial [Mucuna pruriens]
MRHTIPDDYIVFLQEHEDDIGLTKDDPINFCQAMQNLIELPEGMKPIGCKWIFKNQKGFQGLYSETFSLISSNDSFRIIMTLVTHFDLELHQMDKTMFLNGDIDKMIYMVQLENCVSSDFKSMVCKLKKFDYGLKQASCKWYHKFHQVITSCSFEANVVDDCVYHKFSGAKYIFLILYVDEILLASSDTDLSHKTKRFLTKNFEMKDLLLDRSQSIIRLSQENYISKILDRLGMKDSKPRDILIAKGDKFSLKQYPNNDLERNEMSIMYAQVCNCPDIAFVVGVLGKEQKDTCSLIESLKDWRLSGTLTFARYQDSKRFTFGYIYMLAGRAISWKSVKQTLIAPSIMVAKFTIEKSLKIYCDNNFTILYSNNNRSSTKSKFINIKFLVVNERVQNKKISIKHIRTSFMLADPLTKGLILKVFHEHIAHMD